MSNIPEKKISFQYKGDPDNTPDVANGNEVTVYAETIDEIFQKEPNFTPIPKGPEQHYKGPETLVVDTLKATHKFQITGWVYNNDRKKFSFDDDDLDDSNNVQCNYVMTVDKFDTFVPMGDAMIEYGTFELYIGEDKTGTLLTEGDDYVVDRDRGRLKILSDSTSDSGDSVVDDRDSNGPNTRTESDFFGNTNTFIDVDFYVDYTCKGSARNAAKAIQKMSQLGGTIVMRVGNSTYTTKANITSGVDTTSSKAYTVLPKKIKANNKAGKPDEAKLEMEVRVSSDKRV